MPTPNCIEEMSQPQVHEMVQLESKAVDATQNIYLRLPHTWISILDMLGETNKSGTGRLGVNH